MMGLIPVSYTHLVLTSLRHRAVSRSNNQDRAVHLRSTGDHVFNIVGVARAVYVLSLIHI